MKKKNGNVYKVVRDKSVFFMCVHSVWDYFLFCRLMFPIMCVIYLPHLTFVFAVNIKKSDTICNVHQKLQLFLYHFSRNNNGFLCSAMLRDPYER